ncbi:MAG: hypothetical protein ABIF40_00370 [archaeon]
MNFLQLITEGKTNDMAHKAFTRLGKGEYDRFLITIKQGKDLKIKTSFDCSNLLFSLIANNIDETVPLSGKIIAPRDFESELNIPSSNFSKRGKLYTAEFNTEATPEQLKELNEKFKTDFILLIVKGKNYKLKSGKSLPKPGGKIKDNFCTATLPKEFVKEFAFDFPTDFKEAQITHKLLIDEIVVPEEYKNDFVQARLHGQRKGKVKRIIEVDGKQEEKTYNILV